jgi:hypothetical protein
MYPFKFSAGEGDRIQNLTLADNIVYKWGGGAGGWAAGYIQTTPTQFSNLTIEYCAFESLDVPILEIAHSSALSQITSRHNNFFTNYKTDSWYRVGGINKSLGEFLTGVGDTTSTSSPATYPSPESATIAGFHASLGRTATHEAFMQEALKQSRDNWRNEYTAASVNNWIRTCFGK